MYLASIGTYSNSCKFTEENFTNVTDTAMGITTVYTNFSGPIVYSSALSRIGALSYWVISLSLNVLLTLLIVVRLVIHSRSIRRAMGTSFGLYKSIISMLIESCALYASSFLVYIVTSREGGGLVSAFQPILGGTQVRASLMQNLRVVR